MILQPTNDVAWEASDRLLLKAEKYAGLVAGDEWLLLGPVVAHVTRFTEPKNRYLPHQPKLQFAHERRPVTIRRPSRVWMEPMELAKVKRALVQELKGCSVPGWDGYDARPAKPYTIPRAVHVAKKLPTALWLPYCSFDNDGDAFLEWEAGDRSLTIVVDENGGLSFDTRVDGTSYSGTARFGRDDGVLPDRLLNVIDRFVAVVEGTP